VTVSCRSCRSELLWGSAFCPNCGAQLVNVESPPLRLPAWTWWVAGPLIGIGSALLALELYLWAWTPEALGHGSPGTKDWVDVGNLLLYNVWMPFVLLIPGLVVLTIVFTRQRRQRRVRGH